MLPPDLVGSTWLRKRDNATFLVVALAGCRERSVFVRRTDAADSCAVAEYEWRSEGVLYGPRLREDALARAEALVRREAPMRRFAPPVSQTRRFAPRNLELRSFVPNLALQAPVCSLVLYATGDAAAHAIVKRAAAVVWHATPRLVVLERVPTQEAPQLLERLRQLYASLDRRHRLRLGRLYTTTLGSLVAYVEEDAISEQIRRDYAQFALQLHPDMPAHRPYVELAAPGAGAAAPRLHGTLNHALYARPSDLEIALGVVTP